MILKKKTLGFVTAGAIAALLLTGCNSKPEDVNAAPKDEAAKSIFEFRTPTYGSKSALTIQIPQDLKVVAPETKDLLVTSVTAKARQLNSAKYCAVDLQITYGDSGIYELTKPSSYFVTEDGPRSAEAELAVVLKKGSVSSLEELAKVSGGDVRAIMVSNGLPGYNTLGEMQAELDTEYKEAMDVPGWRNLSARLTGAYADFSATNSGQLIDDLNESAPEPGMYTSEDSKTLTSVVTCAESPFDHGKTFSLPYLDSSKPATFASFDMTVMKDGTLTIAENEISGYKLDSNGSWLAK